MSQPDDLVDVEEAHHFFAAAAFNAVWDLLDLDERTPEDDDLLIDTAYASRWHWRHREDAAPRNFAIAAWQLSRVHAVTDRFERALEFGEESLAICAAEDLAPFYVAYAHEAIARAAAGLGDDDVASEHLGLAREAAAEVEDDDHREPLEEDLASIG
ncbi:MAG: hypothetical protein HKN93_04815 [Acidimicrobiia bacterium]|nr:hypothetical protein [Acidimicrobiia bacterium]